MFKLSTMIIPLQMLFAENLDKIENMVEQKFQEIQNADRSCFRCPGHPCTPEHLQVRLLVVLSYVLIQRVESLELLEKLLINVYTEGF